MAAQTYDIVVEQGSTFKLRLRPTSVSISFAACSARGQIRKTYSSPTVLADFTCSTGSDVNGIYIDVSLSDTVTSALPVTPASNFNKKDTFYCYDIECILANNNVIRLIQGSVEVSPEVTR